MFITKSEVEAICKGVRYTVPKGTEVHQQEDASVGLIGDYFFVKDLSFIDGKSSPEYRMTIHDPYYYGIRVPAIDVVEVRGESDPCHKWSDAENNVDIRLLPYQTTNISDITASMKGQGLRHYAVSPVTLNITELAGRHIFRRAQRVWTITPAQAAAFQAKLDRIKEIRAAQEEQIQLTLEAMNII